MTDEHIRSGSRERVMSLYQLDPVFYRKIISRNSSMGSSSGRSGCYHIGANGNIPFDWEMEPGEPRKNPTKPEIVPPIGLPPGVSRQSFPPMENVKKVKKTKKIHVKLPWPIRYRLNLNLSRPKICPREAKAYLMKQVKQIKNEASCLSKPNEKFCFKKCDTKRSAQFDFYDANDVNGFSKSSISLSKSFSSLPLSSSISSFNPVSTATNGNESARIEWSWKIPRVIRKWKDLKLCFGTT